MQYPRFDRSFVSIGTACLSWAVMTAAFAGNPSQLPLLAPTPVAPNVVFTLDDSGSMLSPIMPEEYTSDYPNSNGNVSTAAQNLTPQEEEATPATLNPSSYGYVNQLVPTRGSSALDNAATVIDDAKRRSSRFNTIYYNPEVSYKPWIQADGTRMPYPAPDSTGHWKVPLDPLPSLIAANTAQKVDLSVTGAAAFTSGGRDATDKAISINHTDVSWCAVPVVYSGKNIVTTTTVRPGTPGNLCVSVTPSSIGKPSETTERTALRDSYDPAVFYEFNANGTQARRVSLNEGSAGTTFARGAARTDCTISSGGATCTRAQEFKNFATWFVYHRTRLLLAKAAVAEAFSSSKLRNFRFGYGALNNPTDTAASTSAMKVDGVSTSTLQAGVRDYTISKSNFFNWMFGKRAYSGTPLRRAVSDVGAYFQREDSQSPWADDPSTSGQKVAAFASCRKAFHIMTTDGYWSDGASYAANNSAAQANVDGQDGLSIQDATGKKTYKYSATDSANSRYVDKISNTLADVAMYYWNHDLSPNMANAVSPSDTDPAFWQHMVTYTVGLGVNNSINPWDTKVTPVWPSSSTLTDADKANDLVHASYNSHGLGFSASDSTTFASRLVDILQNISNQSYSTAGVGASGSALTTGFAIYTPSYNSGNWSGDLKKFGVNANTGKLIDVIPATPDIIDPVWSAASLVPDFAQRNIFYWNGSAAASFTQDNVGNLAGQMGSTPTVNADLINYLRGDTSNEGLDSTDFRSRSGRLGDIVNSAPVSIQNSVNLFYSNLPEKAGTGYVTFINSLANRPPLIFVGANDGMLHAFSDSATIGAGKEVFAFIPQAVLPKLGQLSSQAYTHQFYVDGPLTETHAFQSGQWYSILLGSMGAGGKGAFALNVTNTGNFVDADLARKSIMWEINGTTSSAVGNIYNEIEVGPIRTGKDEYRWVALMGNGNNSASNRAQLLIVDVLTGEIIRTLDTAVGTSSAPNGLGGVRSARDARGIILAAYAGDAQGNLWRFDLSGGDTSSWSVGFGGKALFTATDGSSAIQPITATPSVFFHPKGGSMVVFATGKLIEDADRVAPSLGQVQAAYGIWDKVSRQDPTTASLPITKSKLVEQTISSSTNLASTAGASYYQVSNNLINWKSGNLGWFMNLTLGTGQRNIYPTQIIGDYVFLNTVVPASTGSCGDSTSYQALLNPFNGNVGTAIIFDTNGDGTVNSSDKSAAWYSTVGSGSGRIKIVNNNGGGGAGGGGAGDSSSTCKNGKKIQTLIDGKGNSVSPCVPIQPGARTWRILTNPPH